MSEDVVVAYTDGACSGNPGPGGWGVFLRWREHEKKLCGGEPRTTNNRMELMAAISALESLKRPMSIRIFTDSTYVRDGITQWIKGWKANGWVTRSGEPVKNAELWKQLEAATRKHTVEWCWVRGHNGDPGNELADALARQGIPR